MKKKNIIIGAFCALLVLIGIAAYVDATFHEDIPAPPSTKTESLSLELTPFEEPVLLVKQPVAAYSEGTEETAAQLYDWYRTEYGHLDDPLPVRIRFQVKGIPKTAIIQKQTVEISKSADFENPYVYAVAGGEDQLSVYNLETDTTYHYRVTVTLDNGETTSAVSTFTTADTPRFLLVDGLRNVRDVGGVKTENGKVMKSGMVYRGVELRGVMSSGKYALTAAGEKTFVEELGIKTDMDMRSEAESGDIVAGTQRKNYSLHAIYSEIFTRPSAPAAMRKIFVDLADEQNYPVYIHCTWGSDRTGTVVFLLHSLLGVSPEEGYKSWDYSSFFHGGTHEAEMKQFVTDLQAFEGETFQEKVENYLLSIGVTEEQIASIRRINLMEE